MVSVFVVFSVEGTKAPEVHGDQMKASRHHFSNIIITFPSNVNIRILETWKSMLVSSLRILS
jgi:hypothetical protein